LIFTIQNIYLAAVSIV